MSVAIPSVWIVDAPVSAAAIAGGPAVPLTRGQITGHTEQQQDAGPEDRVTAAAARTGTRHGCCGATADSRSPPPAATHAPASVPGPGPAPGPGEQQLAPEQTDAQAGRQPTGQPSASSQFAVRRQSSVVRRPSSVVCRLSSVVCRLPSVVHRPASMVRCPPPTAYCQPPTAYRQPPTVNRLPPTANHRPSAAYRQLNITDRTALKTYREKDDVA